MGRAQNTENVFSADGLLPPDQKRGHILGAYNEREAAYSTEGGTQKRTLYCGTLWCTWSMGCDCSHWAHSSLSMNTTTITMATNKRRKRTRPLTLAEAEAQCKGYMVARTRKRMKGGKPYDIIHVAPPSQQAGPSFQSHFDRNTSQDGVLEQPPANGGMLEDHTTHFGPQDGPQKPGRAPGLVREKWFQTAAVFMSKIVTGRNDARLVALSGFVPRDDH